MEWLYIVVGIVGTVYASMLINLAVCEALQDEIAHAWLMHTLAHRAIHIYGHYKQTAEASMTHWLKFKDKSE